MLVLLGLYLAFVLPMAACAALEVLSRALAPAWGRMLVALAAARDRRPTPTAAAIAAAK